VAGCTPSTATASVGFDGRPANVGLLPPYLGNPHRLSGTGRFVVFDSNATNLVPGGTQAGGVFVRDACIGAASGCTPTTVLVSRDSGVFIPGHFSVISSDGHYCAFYAGVGAPQFQQAVLAATGF